ncbi:GNAT family N-acetyltransferase [Rossellomorea vietnamensis]|uniref:GNAT family N-acetyltransferase n=1 Tax=Rossellomorea vietnamensis TaxID=218284 RepID=UPI001E2B1066|nr:GNAT family N-acetyltransferase [Rossellomorea vietnamensis]MCC5803587.1 GNAT family N-acetyltransferase [Rossellomorea vietnamensis]
MAVIHRQYEGIHDYEEIRMFLETEYLSYETRFDHSLTLFEFQTALSRGLGEQVKTIEEVLENVHLWFNGERLVGFLEEGAFYVAADNRIIFEEMVEVAGSCFSGMEWEVYEGDTDFEEVLLNKGFIKSEEYWVRRDFDLSQPVDKGRLPEGYEVRSVPDLKEQEEIFQAYKLCYGLLFNQTIFDLFHETSTYRKELDLVVTDHVGKVVALCSGRYEERNELLTIEAVSCFPEYRGRGISKALLRELLLAAKEWGATQATVYTGMPDKFPAPNRLYESAGFKLVGKRYVWKKE